MIFHRSIAEAVEALANTIVIAMKDDPALAEDLQAKALDHIFIGVFVDELGIEEELNDLICQKLSITKD